MHLMLNICNVHDDMGAGLLLATFIPLCDVLTWKAHMVSNQENLQWQAKFTGLNLWMPRGVFRCLNEQNIHQAQVQTHNQH